MKKSQKPLFRIFIYKHLSKLIYDLCGIDCFYINFKLEMFFTKEIPCLNNQEYPMVRKYVIYLIYL